MMNVTVLHMYPFPIGMAATNRILAYSKGLVNNGCDVNVLCLNPCNSTDIPRNEVYQGIKYEYNLNPKKSKLRYVHILKFIYSLLISLLKIWERCKNKEIDYLIISTENRFILRIFSYLCKIYGVKSIFIFDEYPFQLRYCDNIDIVEKVRIKYNTALKNVSGFISITSFLNKFYNKDLHKPCLIFPTITDISRFPDKKVNSINKNICYMGSLDLSKDNVQLIIDAFDKVNHKYPDLKFHIYGSSSSKDFEFLKKIIESKHLQRKVILKGEISFEQVPQILVDSYMLVSSQVNTPRIQAGLSTKLGEYLYSGTPVLLSNVGKISNYVQDNFHLFLAEPNNVDDYANKMEFIINNYDYALKIANQGRDYINQNSSHLKMGLKLKLFLKSL